MRDGQTWRETKYVSDRGALRGSRDVRCVGRGSRFICDVVAPVYQQLLQTHARGRLLDAGCGPAPLYGCYRSLVSETLLCDWPGSAHSSRHVDVACDLNGILPFESTSFDTVLATDVLEHLPQPEIFVGEVARVLRPGGALLLGAPFLYAVHEEPHDYHRYTRYRLRGLCEGAGMSVERLEPYGGVAEVLLDLTAKQLDRSRILSAVHLFLATIFEKSALARIVRSRTAERFPLGYVLVARMPR